MKILICTGIYPPDIGGPATYSKLLFDELPKKGIDIGVLSFGEVRHLLKIIRHFIYFLKILKRAKKADVIFAQDPVSVGLPACLASFFLRKKFFLKIVGDYAWEQQQQETRNKKQETKFVTPEEFQVKTFDWATELRRKVERGVAKRADKIIVPSEYLKKIVLSWGVEEKKINVIYNSFDLTESIVGSPTRLSGRQASNEKSDFTIVSAGRLVPWKGFNTLVEIMPEILKKIPEAKLTIIGSGPQQKNLKSQISNLKIDKNVLLTGQLLHEEVLQHLRAGDLFVLNTGYEGLSHHILEAMAVGIPVITTNVGGNPELIENNHSGFLVEYNNREQLKKAIFDLYENGDVRNKFIKNAKDKAGDFSKERMVNDTIAFFLKNAI